MKGRLDKRITIQKLNDNEDWEDYYSCAASKNTASGREYFSSGAEQSANSVIFTIRYCKKLGDIELETQIYRIIFKNGIYDIESVDNYMSNNEKLIIKAVGKSGNQD